MQLADAKDKAKGYGSLKAEHPAQRRGASGWRKRFGNGEIIMSMKHIRDTYGVPAKRGGRIRFEGRDIGTIVAARHGRLRIRFEGQKRIAFLHPTWEVEYLPNTKVETPKWVSEASEWR
jgi:hypothetical protein